MENTIINNNDEIKPIRLYTKAQQKASKYITKKIKIMKNINKEIGIKQNELMK